MNDVDFSGTQFRWTGTQIEDAQWSINSLFVGECPEYCHDRGLCTVSGCQCAIGYSGRGIDILFLSKNLFLNDFRNIL
jgi:hypothetical protein